MIQTNLFFHNIKAFCVESINKFIKINLEIGSSLSISKKNIIKEEDFWKAKDFADNLWWINNN